MSDAIRKQFVLTFTSKSYRVITTLFFACGEIERIILSAKNPSVAEPATISPAKMKKLSAAARRIDKNLSALRDVFPEAWCLGFADGLRAAGRKKLLSSYPDIEQIVKKILKDQG